MAGTVTVGCKMPNGLHLDIVTVFRDDAGRILRTSRERFATLKGASVKHGALAPGQYDAAFTNVDADKFARWVDQNAGSSILEDGLVFAEAKLPDAVAHAKDEVTRPGQFTPLKEGGDQRWVKGIAKNKEEAA